MSRKRNHEPQLLSNCVPFRSPLTNNNNKADLNSSARDHDFKLLEDLVHEDSMLMLQDEHRKQDSESRAKRDTLDEEMAKLKKTSTKKPTQLIKQKPTSAQLFKSSLATAAYPATENTPSRIENNDSGHSSPLSVSSASTFPSSSLSSASASAAAAEGNPFFAPEDVTLPPNSNSTVSAFRALFANLFPNQLPSVLQSRAAHTLIVRERKMRDESWKYLDGQSTAAETEWDRLDMCSSLH